jgi:hypothetical protein
MDAMFNRFQIHAMVLVVVASCCHFAWAQASSRKPLSDLRSMGSEQIATIRREDIGTGYSVNSLNQISLSNARANVLNYSGIVSRSSQVPRPSFGPTSGPPGGKPFAGYTPEPTVSPYLNLFREDLDGSGDLNYNTLVRPQLQQQQFNQQMQRQSLDLAKRLQSMAAQSDFNPEGSKSQYPTGHSTTFMYYGHYYPAPRPRR